MAKAQTAETAAVVEISRVPGTEIIELLPDEITLLDEQNVRQVWEGDETAIAKQQAKLAELMESIKKNGQLQPVGVRELETGEEGRNIYELLYGHRRVAAIALYNETAKKPMKVQCTVLRDVDAKSALQKAMAENLHRVDFSPMQLAMDIQRIRAEFGWDGSKGTRSVAGFLGVSPATVTQHEKLFTLDDEIQAQVHNGTISAQSAFDLAAVKPEKRKAVMDKATELQSQADGTEDESGEGGEGGEGGENAEGATGSPAKITRGNVLAAARQTEDALQVAKPMTRKEILSWFEQFDGPGNGFANSDERQFVRYFVGTWAKGEGSDKKLNKLWAELTQDANEGFETKADKPAEVAEPGAGKKGKAAKS